MNKINGYTEEEATGLIEYIYSGRNAGKTLSYLFETYGRAHSRAKGSVCATITMRSSKSRTMSASGACSKAKTCTRGR